MRLRCVHTKSLAGATLPRRFASHGRRAHPGRAVVATLSLGSFLLATVCVPSPAIAGGSPEQVLLIIDPTSAESMYLGNYYKHARKIPDRNILYMDPGAVDYAQFAAPGGNIDALLGSLVHAGIDQTIHYIVLAPSTRFYIDAPGYVEDTCWPVARFSLSSAYILAFNRSTILAGGITSSIINGYYSGSTSILPAFDSTTAWLGGVPNAAGRRFYISALLGYTGERGNTVAEIRDMIDRSVAADGLRPVGTYYFMNTTDAARNVRAPQFNATVGAIAGIGGAAQVINGVLPTGKHDILGILTGWADPPVDTEDMTILPGSFADHLTSWAATFDIGLQTKLSAWIRRGASASSGTVEEPCAYIGKFPIANLHHLSRRGMSLGEAWFRSVAYMPFQQLLVGDPLTRPFAYLPTVEANLPPGIVSGQVFITPDADTSGPGLWINSIDMFINGVRVQTRQPGFPFSIDTSELPDGHNEVRFVAYDSTQIRSAGGSVGTLRVSNHGLSAQITPSAVAGNLTTRFTFNVSVSPVAAMPPQLRLLQNGRVVAAATGNAAALHVHGRNLGAGQSRVQLEGIFADGRRVLSEAILLDVSPTAGQPSGQPPVAYGYTRRIIPGESFIVELPASFDDELSSATYQLLAQPVQAVIGGGGGVSAASSGPYRVFSAPQSAVGSDTLTFRVTTPSGQSGIATITLIYSYDCYANCDGSTVQPILNIDDFTCFINEFAVASGLPHAQQVVHYANCDQSTIAPVLNIDDFTCFINRFAQGCD